MDATKANILAQQKLNYTTDTDYGLWYDWFCKTKSLANKTKAMASRVNSVLKANTTGRRFNPELTYVFFKNNCPAGWGPLYDDFRICDMGTGDVLYTVIPRMGRYTSRGYRRDKVTEFHAELWGKDNNFEGPLVHGEWKDVIAYFEGKE